MKNGLKQLWNGLIKENPTFVLMLGMCPTLATTTSTKNAIGMGLTTTVVLILSNMLISALRKVIPDKVRIPAFIVVIASFVTVVEFLLKAYLPSLNDSLGIYIPLIVVNCIILGRAEAFASKNPVIPSMFDGIGMGLGFTLGLSCIGFFRELIGNGTILDGILPGVKIPHYTPLTIFVMAPGAFFVLAILTALQNVFKAPSATNVPNKKDSPACGGNCMECDGTRCAANHIAVDEQREKIAAEKKEALLKAAAQKKAAGQSASAAQSVNAAKPVAPKDNNDKEA